MDLPGNLVSVAPSCKRWSAVHTLGLVGEEVVDLGNGTVESNDSESVISSVQDQVLTHHGQADQTEISPSGINVSKGGTAEGLRFRRRPADVDSGETSSASDDTHGQPMKLFLSKVSKYLQPNEGRVHASR